MGIYDTLFPRRAARRAELKLQRRKAELRLELLERGFDGAALGRRNDGWRSTVADANAENAPALARLRNRAREQRRNNPYAERAVTGIADNVVGAGIVPRPLAKSGRSNKRLGELWSAWAASLACDADGLENFYGLQHKIMETVVEAGECLIRRRRRYSSDGLPVPVQLQVLEPDFLDERKDGDIAGTQNRIIQGVEFDALGRRVAYWLHDQHPGANNTWRTLDSRRVPAEDVIHVFLPKRPGQARGYSWLAPVLQRLRSFDEMEDAIIEQAKIAACFAAFVSKDETQGSPKKGQAPLIERMEPGIVQELGIGEEISFGTPPTFNGYQAYSWQALHAVAVGLGVPYELLTGDLKGVNFSSGRMGWLHFARRVDVWQWRMLIPQLCDRTWQWFMEAQVLLPGAVLEDVRAEWVPPRRDMVDPKAETENVKERIRNGLTSWPDALRELGVTDPIRHAEQIAEANRLLDEKGLILDCDPRKAASPGSAAPAQPTNESENNAGSDDQDA
ncbi:phage portal protein [Azotobacter chroococcum]|uniref:Phage portal protein, lambda family n=1 Tax=Azotobacter chroococcum NCIMB 8003 TaxID=1328314 RepID=A0A0C4WPK1_9GAMM|nr:phage portal protein [Azotobacter chroococcum]AJE21490.1 Phage portal protein, lambda family [Azotobacter chroococcum NCIMB 8003]